MSRRLIWWVVLAAFVPAFTLVVAWWIQRASTTASWIEAITAASALVASVAGLVAAVAGARAAEAARVTAGDARDALGYTIKPELTIGGWDIAPYGVAQRQPKVYCGPGFGAVDLEYECHYRNGRMFVASRGNLGGSSDPAEQLWTIKDVGPIWDPLKNTFSGDFNRHVLRYSDSRRVMRWEIIEHCVPDDDGDRRQLERSERRVK